MAANAEGWTINPKKDKTITIPKLYEFQFYDDFEAIFRLGQDINKMIGNFDVVPEHMKERFNAMLATGFSDWSLSDY